MIARVVRAFVTTCVLSHVLHAAPALRVAYSSDGTAWISWTAVAGADQYDVERTTLYPGWSLRQRLTGTAFAENGLTAGTTYIYRVVPRDAALNPVGPPSNVAIVSTHGHGTDPLAVGQVISAQHVLDLRAVMRSVSVASGRGEPTWTNASLV